VVKVEEMGFGSGKPENELDAAVWGKGEAMGLDMELTEKAAVVAAVVEVVHFPSENWLTGGAFAAADQIL